MTFKDLQDVTYDYVNELAGAPGFDIAKIKLYLNRAEKDFVRKTKCHQREIDVTSVANQVSYDSDDAANLAYIYHVINVRYINAGETERGHKLTFMDQSRLPERYEYGDPYWYWVTGNNDRDLFKIGTHPIISESSGTLRIKAFCFPNQDMSSDAQEPYIKEAWRDALPEFAAYRIFRTYSHLKREYSFRAREHKAAYDEIVDDINYHSIKQTDEFTQVEDVYNEENSY